MRRILALLSVLLLLGGLAACRKKPAAAAPTQPIPNTTGPMVGICMPEETGYWLESVRLLEAELWSLGYQTHAVYAQADAATQSAQIEEMVQEQVRCIVIAPVDAMSLTAVLETAREAGIFIVAFDRQITDTVCVDFLVTFDYQVMGSEMGDYIVTAKGLDNEALEESYNVEFIMGSAEDTSALHLHSGLMDVLQPYLDAGILECISGRTAFADTYTTPATGDGAAQKLTAVLEQYGKNETLDILCVSSDEMAKACFDVLVSAGYTEERMPLIIAQGGLKEGIRQIVAGQQTATIYKDLPGLAKHTATVADGLLTGKELSGDKTINNYAADVQAILCDAFLADSGNYQELIVDAGIYRQEELNP